MIAKATHEDVQRGRSSFEKRAWGDAFDAFSAAERRHPLEPDDLERFATAAYLIGKDEDSAEIWARAQNELATRKDPARAARCAFWLALTLLNKGEMSRGGGWLARAARLLEEVEGDCA